MVCLAHRYEDAHECIIQNKKPIEKIDNNDKKKIEIKEI